VQLIDHFMFVSFGQAGARIGDCFWELISHEHQLNNAEKSYPKFLFHEDSQGMMIPNCLFVDKDSHFSGFIRRNSHCNQLYSAENFVLDDSSGSFEDSLSVDQIRRASERETFRSFIVTSSMTSNTSSSLCTPIIKVLREQYPKLPFLMVDALDFIDQKSIDQAASNINDINSNLMMHYMFDNANLFFQARRSKIQYPNYSDINYIIGQILCSITSGSRFVENHYFDYTKFFSHLMQGTDSGFFTPEFYPILSPRNEPTFSFDFYGAIAKKHRKGSPYSLIFRGNWDFYHEKSFPYRENNEDNAILYYNSAEVAPYNNYPFGYYPITMTSVGMTHEAAQILKTLAKCSDPNQSEFFEKFLNEENTY